MQQLLFSTNTQKVLSFFLGGSDDWVERSIVEKKTRLSKAGVNFALRDLDKRGLLVKVLKGNTCLYKLNFIHPVNKQLKILNTTIKLYPLLKKVQYLTKKIILFGSASRGENIQDSDIDLFILTRNIKLVKKTVKARKSKTKIQLVIKTPTEWMKLEKKDPYFYREVDRGIVLWETYE